MEQAKAGQEFPLLPQWQDDFVAMSNRLAAERLDRISLLGLLVNLPLLAAVDLRSWINGAWERQPAYEHMFWWRLALIAVSLCYVLWWRLAGARSVRPDLGAWAMLWAAAGLGVSFTLIVQPIVNDSSIFALVLFVIASMLPLPGKTKLAVYPAAFAVLAGGLWLGAPDLERFINTAINPLCCTVVALVVDRMVFRSHRLNYIKSRIIEDERGKSDRLLRNVLPEEVAKRLRDAPEDHIVEFHGEVSVLFADVVGFTQMSMKLPASDLIRLLDRLFLAFDEAADRLGIEKIKTIGDSYMAACGVPLSSTDHAERVAALALEMLAIIRRFDDDPELPLSLRIGIHSGPAIAGVIGRKKFCYDLWGDTVNTASRLESHGEPGRIHVSEQIYHHLKNSFAFQARGPIVLRGKGAMQTYFLDGAR